MHRYGFETSREVGSRAGLALALVLALTGCTGGQSGHEGAGLDGPTSMTDAGPEAGEGGGPAIQAGAGGAPADFGNPDGATVDEDDAGADASDEDGGGAPPIAMAPALHGNEDVCAASTIDAPLDCLDVCGTLFTCDPDIACDECLAHCVESPEASFGRIRCLSRVIYLIDEDGCAAMVRAYEAYLAEASCAE